MKDFELDQILKSAPIPDRPEAYWHEFPRRVMAKAHWHQTRAQVGADGPRTEPSPPVFWRRFAIIGLELAVIGLLLGVAFGFRHGRNLAITNPQLAAARKYCQEIETLFPNQVQAIVFDQQGPRLVLAEQPDVPASSPLYLRICGPSGCKSFVTFSGQQIRVNGDVFEVLVDRRGDVLLVGRQSVWSSAQAETKTGRYRIEARNLEAAS